VQSDKASVTITSRYDGTILKIHHGVDEIALVGKPLLDFEIEDEDGDSSDSDSDTDIKQVKVENIGSTVEASNIQAVARSIVPATPAVRRIAMENKVDLSKVKATGRNGRVLKGDVLEYLGEVPAGTNIPHPTIAAKAHLATNNSSSVIIPADRVEPLKGIRKAMLKSMTECLVRSVKYY